MRHYHKNPRQITEKQFTDLRATLRELGDLSGIVHDLNSDEIIGGNQRGRVFDINDCQIEYVKKFDQPDEQGTIAVGFVVWEGKLYNYREVRWTEKQCEKANIIANKAGGTWDFDTLANQWELPDLIEWGFKPYELGVVDESVNPGDAWKGMPDFGNAEKPYRTINIHFECQEDVDNFADFIDQKIGEKTKYIWYPAKEKQELQSLGFENES